MKTQNDVDVERLVYLIQLQDKLFMFVQTYSKNKPIQDLFLSAYMSNIEETKKLLGKLGIK